ncbi:alpha/beta hydrolase family protein [Nonomuraea cavernae]|uniref:alpha/beta hydrolase family protein n=1 Tax=Nonomuraea cavernae TaxID=2045107 RepID=UPI0033FC41DB
MPAAALNRISFSFAADGSHAACLTRQGDGPLRVERWSFSGRTPLRETLSGEQSIWTQLLTLTDGRILFTRPGRDHNRLMLAEDGLAERTLLTVACPAVRLIASPDPRLLAVAVGTAGERSTIWRVPGDGSSLETVAELPGVLTGGHPLDTGGALGFNQRLGDTVRPVVVDLHSGGVMPLPGTSPGQHLLLSAPSSGRQILAGTVGQRLRLGHADAGSLSFPGVLDTIDGSVAPMAADPTGEDVALRVNRGACSQLMVYTPRMERIRQVPIPPGVIGHGCAWGAQGLRFPFSAPAQPGGIATVDPATGRWDLAADDAPGWAGARVEQFAGPGGPIEAVVYGDPRRARRLLISLHGGPEAATQLGFDPLMQAVAGAGIAIVAPNYRGSIGYGSAHQRALLGAWGGPDLADIRHLARRLARPGQALLVHGTSYGAYLALLAACADPDLWSGCVAVSPFLSGPRLYAEGSPGVRALLDRLGGRTVIDDDLGPRDVARLCERITARLLIVHARNDEVIPVSQSRELRARLLSAGRHEGRDFTYLESPTGGHDLISGHIVDALLRFLLAA